MTSDTTSFADISDPVAVTRYAGAQADAEVRRIHELMARGIMRPSDDAEAARLLDLSRDPFATPAEPGSLVSELGDVPSLSGAELPPSNLYDSTRIKFDDPDRGARLLQEAERYLAHDGVPAGSQWVGDNLFTAEGKLYATRLAGGLVVGRDSLLSMEHGADLVEAAERRLYESKHKEGSSGFMASLTSSDDLWSLVPFLGMVADIGGSLYTAKKISDINEKVRNGEQLTVEEAVALKYYMEETDRKANKETTVGSVAGDIVRRAPSFMFEFWLTGGLGSLARSAAANAAARAAAAAGAAAASGVRRLAVYGVNRGAKTFARELADRGLTDIVRKALADSGVKYSQAGAARYLASAAGRQAVVGLERGVAASIRPFVAESLQSGVGAAATDAVIDRVAMSLAKSGVRRRMAVHGATGGIRRAMAGSLQWAQRYASKAVLDWGTFGDAPETMLNYTFGSAGSALASAVGVGLVEAPIKGAIQYGAVKAAQQAILRPFGVAPVSANELSMRTNALRTGNKALYDDAGWMSIGTEMLEYISENSGGMFAPLGKSVAYGAGGAVRALRGTKAPAVAARYVGEIGGIFTEEAAPKAGMSLARILERRIGTKDEILKAVRQDQAGAFRRLFAKKGLAATDAELEAFARSRNADMFRDVAVRDYVRGLGPKYYSKLLNEAAGADLAAKSYAAKVGGFFRVGAADFIARHQLGADEMTGWLRRVGYDGFIEEMLEERYSGFASGLLGLDAEGTHKFFSMENLRQAFRNVTVDMGKDSGLSWEEQLTAEAIGFAMPGLMRTGFRRAIGHVAGGQSELERVRHFARDFTAGHEALSTSEMTAGGYFDSVKESLADIDARIAEEDRKLSEAQAAYAKAGAEKSHQAKSAKVARDEVVRVLQERRDKIVSHLRLTVRANAKAFGVEESDVAKDADLAALEGIVANNRDKLMMFAAYSGASKTQPVYSDEQARRVVDARDDAAKAAAEIGRVLDRSRRAAGAEANSAGRRFAAKVTGILGALITGDISLAQGDPAGWALADAGVSRPAVAALANLHAQEFENARRRLVDAESRQPSGRGAKAFTNEEIEAEMDRDGAYATRAVALVPALMLIDGARMFHRSDVRDQVVMHLATKEGWSYDPQTKEFTRGAERLAFADFARRGQTDAERDAHEKEVDELVNDVSRETMRVMTSGGQFMSFRGFGREDSGLMAYMNLPSSALDKDNIALSIAADLAGFSDAVKTRRLSEGVTVDSMVDASSKHLPADAVHRVAEAANSGQTPDEADVAMVAAAYGADLASLSDEWREKAKAEVARICRLVDSQDSGKEVRAFVGRIENLGGPVLWDDPSYQIVFERKADGKWHATTRASAKLTVNGKDLVTAALTDAELDNLVKSNKLTETTRKIVVTDVTTLTTDDASLMLLKLGGANDHVSACAKLTADGQPDYSCVHPRFRPRPGKTAAEARAEAEAELREEETLASLYDPAADGNLDYFNWGKTLDATDGEKYEKILTERRNRCRAAYNAYTAYMSDIESRLRAAGVSTPTSDTLVNMALGVRERQYVCPIGMWAGVTNGNQYIAADFRRGQDAQSAACMAIVDDAVRRHGSLLRRGGAMRGAVAEFVHAVDNAARNRIVDLVEAGKSGSHEHQALVELRRGLLGDAVAETLPRRTLVVLAMAYGLGQSSRARRNGYCATAYDPALLAIEDEVMKLPSYLPFLAYVDVALGGDGLADFATELRLRRAAAAHPERAKLDRGERGLSRMLSVLRDAGTAAAATADVRPAGMSVENFAAGVANAAFNYSRDREAEQPQQRPRGSQPTWTDYRAALLDAFEKSGILDDLGQGTDIELNERLRQRIEGFLGRLVADGAKGAGAAEKAKLSNMRARTVDQVTDRLATMTSRIADLKGQLAKSDPQAKADLEAKISNLMDATNYLAKELADLAEGLRAAADRVTVNTKDPAAAKAYVDEVNKTIETAEKAYFDARAAQATVRGGQVDLNDRFARVVYAESAMSDAEDDGTEPTAEPAEAEEAPVEDDDPGDDVVLQVRVANIEADARAYDLSESEHSDGTRTVTTFEARPVGDSAALPPESTDYLASTVLALWRVRNGDADVEPSADDVVAVVRELTSGRIADADARAVAGSVAAIVKLGRRDESATGFADGVSDAAGETTSAANFLQHERNVDFLSGKELSGFLYAAELVSPATGRSLPNYLVVVRQSLDALVRSAEGVDEELAGKLRLLVNMLRPRTLLGREVHGRVLEVEADVQAAFDSFASRFDEIVDVDAVVAAAEASGAMSVSFLVSFLKSLESGARRRFLDLVASSAAAGAVAVDKTIDPLTGDSDAAFTLDADPHVNATGFSDGLALASFSKILDMDREEIRAYLDRYFGAYDETFGVYNYANGFAPSGPIDVVEIFSGLFGCESPILLALADERVRSRPGFARIYEKCFPTQAVHQGRVLASETASTLRDVVVEYLDRSAELDRTARRELLVDIVLARAQSGRAPRPDNAFDLVNAAKSANRTSYFRTLMYEYARYMTPAVANGRTIGSRNRSPSSKVTLILRGLPPLVSKFLFAPYLMADGTVNHRSFAAMALRMWTRGRAFQDYAPDLTAVDQALSNAVRDAQAALDARASLDDARRLPYEQALAAAKAAYDAAVAAAPRILDDRPVPYAALSEARRAEVDEEFLTEVLPSLRQDVRWPDGSPVVVKSLDVDRTDGETVGAAARSAKGLFERLASARRKLAEATDENDPEAVAARAALERLRPKHDELKTALEKALDARDRLMRDKAPDYLLKPAEAALKAARAAHDAVVEEMSGPSAALSSRENKARAARKNVALALSGSYYVPLFHGDHATRDIMRVPAALFDAERGAPEEMRVDPAGDPNVEYHKVARVVNTAISLDMLGDDTKRAALSSNESVGTAMRGVGVDADGNATWGENRFHVIMDFALDKDENDSFIGSIFSVGYAVGAQAARAKRGELRAQKTHVMSGWGDKAAFVKGLTVSSSDRTGRFANQAVKDIDEYLHDFRKGTVDRSTSSAVDRDALKVGPLVSTTLGVASPEVAALALEDPAAAAARVKELVELNDRKRPAYGNLYDHVFERLGALEAKGEAIGTLSGEELDKALCDRRDADGNPVADEDGVYRFTWVEAETGRAPTVRRVTVAEALGCTDADADPESGAAVQVRVVKALAHKDGKGVERRTLDFSYVDNGAMSYAVANVAHDARISTHRLPRNHAIDILTYASGQDGDAAKNLMKLLPRWGLLAGVVASSESNVAAAFASSGVRELVAAGAAPGSGPVQNEVAYNVFANVRRAMNPPINATYAPLVSAGAVYRDGVVYDHSKDPFFRAVHRGATVFGRANRERFGAKRRLGYCHANVNHPSVRYMWFADGATKAEQTETLRRAATAVEIELAAAARAIDGDNAEKPAAAPATDDHVALVERIFTLYRKIEKCYTAPGRVLTSEERSAVRACLVSARRAIAKAFVDHHGRSVLELRTVSTRESGEAVLGNTGTVAEYVVFEDLFREDGKFDRTAVDSIPAPAEVDGDQRERTCLGGSLLGCPRTPSYNGFKWAQAMRIATPVTEVLEADGSYTAGREAMISPDAQTLYILGCDHDGDKSLGYMLRGGVYGIVSKMSADDLDPAKFGLDVNATPVEIAAKIRDPAVRARFIESRFVEAASADGSRPEGISDAAKTSMSNAVVASLFDMIRDVPCTVDGREVDADRMFADTDYGRPTTARPISNEARWKKLLAMANAAFNFRSRKGVGLEDSDRGVLVGDSASGSDKARGIAVSLAQALHLAYMSRQRDDLFGPRDGDFGKWIEMIHFIDGVSNATFDDVKEQICLRLGVTPGMADILYGDLLFGVNGRPARTEDEFYDVLSRYVGSLRDGAGLAMLLSSDVSESDVPYEGLSLDDMFRDGWADVLAEDLAEGHAQQDAKRLAHMSSDAAERLRALHSPSALKNRLMRLVSQKGGVSQADVHRVVRRVVFGADGASESTRRAKRVRELFGLAAAKGGLVYTKGIKGASRLAQMRAKFMDALAAKASDAGGRANAVLRDFAAQLAENDGCSALGGYVSGALFDLVAAPASERDGIAEKAAARVFDIVERGGKIKELKRYSGIVNCFKATPSDPGKMANRGRILSDFVDWQQKYGSKDDPADVKAMNATLFAATVAAYDVPDVQTRAGRISIAQAKMDETLVDFAGAVQSCPGAASVGNKLVARIFAAPKWGRGDALAHETTYLRVTNFLAAVFSLPEADAASSDIMSSWPDVFRTMRAIAQGMAEIPTLSYQRAAFTRARPGVLEPLDRALLDERAERWRRDTVAFQQGVVRLFGAFYALVSLSAESTGVMAAAHRFSVVSEEDVDAGDAREQGAAPVGNDRISVATTSRDRNSVTGMRRAIARMLSQDFTTLKRHKTRIKATGPLVDAEAGSFCLTVGNLVKFLRENTLDTPRDTAQFRTSDMAFGTGIPEVADKDQIRLDPPPSDDPCQDLVKLAAWCEALVSANPDGRRGSVRWQADAAASILILLRLADAHKIDPREISISPKALLEQLLPVYSTTVDRVDPGKPSTRSLVDHIPGACERITKKQAELDSPYLDLGRALPKGMRLLDLVAMCNSNRLLEDPFLRIDPEDEAALRGADVSKRPRDPRLAVDEAKLTDRVAGRVTDLLASNVDREGRPQRIEDLEGPLRDARIVYSPEWRAKRSTRRGSVYDVLNDGGIMENLCDWVEEVGAEPAAGRPQPPSAQQAPARPAGPTQPEVASLVAYIRSCVGDKMDVRYDGGYTFTVESKGRLAGSAAALFGLGAKELGAKGAPRAVITFDVGGGGGGASASAAELDVNSPAVAASFCHVFNSTYGKRIGFNLTTDQFFRLTEAERKALVSRVTAGGFASSSSFALARPSWSVDEQGVLTLAGHVSLADADARAALHEYFHSMTGVFASIGMFTEADLAVLRAEFGDAPAKSGFLFDEEAAADAFADWTMRNTTRRDGTPGEQVARGVVAAVRRIFERIQQFFRALWQLFGRDGGFTFDTSAPTSVSRRVSTREKMFGLVLNGYAPVTAARARALGLVKGEADLEAQVAALRGEDREKALERLRKRSEDEGGLPYSENELLSRLSAAELRDNIEFAKLFADEHERVRFADRRADDAVAAAAGRTKAALTAKAKKNPTQLQEDYEALAVSGSQARAEARLRRKIDPRTANRVLRTMKEDVRAGLRRSFDLGQSLVDELGRAGPLRLDVVRQLVQKLVAARGGAALQQARGSADVKLAKSAEADDVRWSAAAAPAPRAAGPYAATYADIMAKNDEVMKILGEWSVNEDTSVGLVYSPLRHVLGGLKHGDDPALVKAAGAAREEAEREFAGRVGAMQDLDRAVAKARHDYHERIVKRGLALAGLDPKAAEDKDSYNMVMSVAHLLRRGRGQLRFKYTVQGGGVRIAGKRQIRVSSSDVAGAIKAANGQPFGMAVADAMADIAKMMNGIPASERGAKPGEGSATWRTGVKLFNGLADVLAHSDVTLLAEGSRTWDDAVDKFFAHHIVGVSPAPSTGAERGPFWSNSNETTLDAVENRKIYALGSAKDAAPDAARELRQRMLERAVSAVLVAAAQVKFSRELGVPAGAVHHNRFVAKAQSAPDFAALSDVLGIGVNHATSDDPLVAEFNTPTFVAVHIGSWLSSTVQSKLGNCDLKRLFMRESQSLIGDVDVIVNAVNRVDQMFGMDRRVGAAVGRLAKRKATHVWGDSGFIEPAGENAPEYEGVDNLGLRSGHRLAGVRHYLRGVVEDVALDEDDARLIDALMKCAWAKLRGGRSLVTGAQMTFSERDLYRPRTEAEIAANKKPVPIDETDLSRDALESWFVRMSGSGDVRQMPGFMLALRNFDQQWNTENGSNLKLDAFRYAVVRTIVRAARDWADDAVRLAAAGPGDFCDFVIRRLVRDDLAVATSERDGEKNSDGDTLLTKCTLAIPVSYVNDAWESSETKHKLVDEAGRDPNKLTLDWAVAQIEAPLRRFHVHLADKPWLSRGDARYLNNYGSMLRTFSGNGVFMMNALKAERDVVAETTARVGRHEETLMRMLANERVMNAPADTMTGAMLAMVHDYFGTAEESEDLRDAIRDGRYSAGSMASVRTGLVLPWNATCKDVARQIYARLLDVKMRALEGRPAERGAVDDAAAVGRMIRAYEAAADAGQPLSGGFGMTDEAAYQLNGALPASMTLGHAAINATRGLQAALYHRSVLVNMLSTPDPDGMPLYFANPSADAVETSGIPDEVWEAITRHNAKKLGAEGVDVAYDPTLSGVENARRVYDAAKKRLVATNGKIFGKGYRALAAEQLGSSKSIVEILCRAPTGDSNEDKLATMAGGEAAGYARQLFEIGKMLDCGYGNVTMQALNHIMAWSKTMKVSFSAFFPWATRWESPTAACGALATILGNLSPDTARRFGKAMKRLKDLGGGPAWADESFLGTRDVLEMMDTDDPFLSDLIVWAESLGITMTSRVVNPNDGAEHHVQQDVQNLSDMIERSAAKGLLPKRWAKAAGEAVKIAYGTLLERQGEKAFTYAMNATKLAVAAQVALRLKNEAMRTGRAFDPVRDMAGMAEYVDSEIGGVNPVRYAWATPGFRRLMNFMVFSWQWTRTAWEAGGGGILEDMLFGGHHVTAEQRRFTAVRWLRMWAAVMYGLPMVIQLASKSMALLLAGIDDDDDPWMAWNNETKVGWTAANIRPLLKMTAKWDATVSAMFGYGNGWKDRRGLPTGYIANLKRHGNPLVALIPMYTGLDPYGRISDEPLYAHAAKQGWEVVRWGTDPWGQITSKLSMPMQSALKALGVVSDFAGGAEDARKNNSLDGKPRSSLWNALSPARMLEALAGPTADVFAPFSTSAFTTNSDAGLIGLALPVQRSASYTNIKDRMESLIEHRVYNDAKMYAAGRENLRRQTRKPSVRTGVQGVKKSPRFERAEWPDSDFQRRTGGFRDDVARTILEDARKMGMSKQTFAYALQDAMRGVRVRLVNRLIAAMPKTAEDTYSPDRIRYLTRCLYRSGYTHSAIFDRVRETFGTRGGVKSWADVDPGLRRRIAEIDRTLLRRPLFDARGEYRAEEARYSREMNEILKAESSAGRR